MKLGTAETSTIYKSDACSGKFARVGPNKKSKENTWLNNEKFAPCQSVSLLESIGCRVVLAEVKPPLSKWGDSGLQETFNSSIFCTKSGSGCLSRRIHLARQGALFPEGVVLGESGKKKERSKALLRTQFEGRGFHSNRASPSPGTGGGCYLSDSSTRTP